MPSQPPTIGKPAKAIPAPRYDGRLSASARGYDSRWTAYARTYLAQHPMCKTCEHSGRTTLAQLVDHIHPVTKGALDPLMWEPTNHQPLCRRCHARKTHADRRAGLTR